MHETIIIHMNHMDTVWKRPWSDYAEIEGDIINKALEMMERYPEFTFCIEQAVVIDGYLENYPEKKDILKKRIREGQLELIGGAWTLIDLNMVMGESIIRNYMIGLNYLQKEFGLRLEVGCFTDAFGLNCQMPQILNQFGMKYTLQGRTVAPPGEKNINHPFIWLGIDGSKVLSGINMMVLINGWYEPMNSSWVIKDIDKKIRDVSTKAPLSICLVLSEEVLPRRVVFEKLLDRAHNETEIKYSFGKLKDYYVKLEKLVQDGIVSIGQYKGEFNPVFTGCYTTRSAIKIFNSIMQTKLLDTEALMTAALMGGFSSCGNHLQKAWREVIFNQFHDSLCGCNSAYAFDDIMSRYVEADREINKVYRFFERQFSQKGDYVFNPLPFSRSGLVCLEASNEIVLMDGKPVDQVLMDNRLYVDLPQINGLGFAQITMDAGTKPFSLNNSDDRRLENEFYSISIEEGMLSSITCKLSQLAELIGDTGCLVIREDKGGFWTTRPTGRVVKCMPDTSSTRVETSLLLKRVICSGVLKGTPWDEQLTCHWEIEVRLWKNADKIDFIYRINWHGSGSILSVAIPLPENLNSIDYETPFAVLGRKRYPPEPEAAFNNSRGGEWPSLRFVSASNGNYGVSLVHQGYHGVFHDKTALYINLLRSPDIKNNEAGTIFWDKDPVDGVIHEPSAQEEGYHEYFISMRIHEGNWETAGILRLADELYHPLMIIGGRVEGNGIELEAPPNIGYSALKPSEDGTGIVFRLWEGAGKETTCCVKIPGVAKAFICTMGEEKLSEISVDKESITIEISSYKIITVLLSLKK